MKMELAEAIMDVKEKFIHEPERSEDEKDVISRYGRIFNQNNLDCLTVNDFKSFLVYKNNKHWIGMQRRSNEITKDMGSLQSVLKLLLDESKPLKERLEIIRPKKGFALVKGLGRAVITPILMVVYPDKYCVFNGKTERAMKRFGIFPVFSRKTGFAEKYIKVNEIIAELAKKNGMSHWQIDVVWGISA